MRRFICATLIFTVAVILGCDGDQLSKNEERQAAQNEKVKAALENQSRQALSKPPELEEKNPVEPTGKDGAENLLVATEVLETALKSAKSENKAVLVHFTADW